MANTTTGRQPENRPRRTIIARLRGQPQPIEIKLKVKSDTKIELHPNSPNSSSTQPTPGSAGPGGQSPSPPQTPLGTNTGSPNSGLGRQPGQDPASQAPDQPGSQAPGGQPDSNQQPDGDAQSPGDQAQPAGGAPAESPYDQPGNSASEPGGQPGQAAKPGEPADNGDADSPNQTGQPNPADPSAQSEAPSAGGDDTGGQNEPASPDLYNPGENDDAGTEPPANNLADKEAGGGEPAAGDDSPQPMSLADREGVYDRPGNEPSPAPTRGGKTAADPKKSNKAAGPEEDTDQEHPDKAKSSGDDDQVGNGYKPSTKSNTGRLRGLLEQRLIIGLFGVLGIAALIFFGSFLSAFKLSGIMENISARTFARLQGVEDRRSQAWMRAYIQIRLMDIGNHPDLSPGKEDNLLFRSHGLSTTTHFNSLVFDWYRTLRASAFERDVFEKHGIIFTSYIGDDGKVRQAKIHIDGQGDLKLKDLKQQDIDDILHGKPAALNKLNAYVSEVYDNDKAARQAIRKVVWDNTQDWQVFKRRHVRQAIQGSTGARDWRFFEGTREKIDDKKLDIRNKIIAKAVPNSTKGGKFIHCLFGISDCKDLSGDPEAPSNQDTGALDGDGNIRVGDPVDQQDPKTGKLSKLPVDPEGAGKAVRKITSDILQKVTPVVDVVNVVSTLDSLNKVNNAIKNGSLTKVVAVARGVQAMGLYQVYQTAADQTKSGDVNTQELNAFMGTIDTGASSEGWTDVISGNGNGQPLAATASAATVDTSSTPSQKKTQYCSAASQAALAKDPDLPKKQPDLYGYAYQCPDQQIGGGSRAKQLQDGYEQSIGQVLNPILTAYTGVRTLPVIGGLLDIVTKLSSTLSGALYTHAIQPVLNALGVGAKIEELLSYVTTKMVAFVGAGPIMNGAEPAGVFMNWIIQGAAYTAETTVRMLGGSLTTTASMRQSQIAMAGFAQDQAATSSLKDHLFDNSNPHSLSAKTAVALAGFSPSKLTGKLFNLGWLGNIFGFAFHPAGADTVNGYAASNFAGIQTYDYPESCYADPLTMTPQTSTNIQAVLGKDGASGVPDADLTWDLMTNSGKWYAYVYGKTKNDKLTETIYNCALLDTSIRGSIGYLYGYSNDGGLDDTTANVVNSSDTSNSSGSGSYRSPFHDTKNLTTSRIDEGVDYATGSSVPLYAIGNGVVTVATEHSSFYTTSHGYATWITYRLTDGPAAGKYVYVSEACSPVLVHAGQQVTADTQLCTVLPDSIETGWALDDTSQAAAAVRVYIEGYETAYGMNFNSLLTKLGAPSGHLDSASDPSGKVLGTLPDGWPTW